MPPAMSKIQELVMMMAEASSVKPSWFVVPSPKSGTAVASVGGRDNSTSSLPLDHQHA